MLKAKLANKSNAFTFVHFGRETRSQSSGSQGLEKSKDPLDGRYRKYGLHLQERHHGRQSQSKWLFNACVMCEKLAFLIC